MNGLPGGGTGALKEYAMSGKTNGARADEMNGDGKKMELVGLLKVGEGSLAIQ